MKKSKNILLEQTGFYALEVFAELDGMKEAVRQQLIKGMQSFDSVIRKEYCFLTGHFMGKTWGIDEEDNKILNHLFFSVCDTNVEVSSEAIRGFANIAKRNISAIPKSMLIDLIYIVKDTLSRKHVGYLTHLAFFLKEISKLEKLEAEQTTLVKEAIKKLKNMPYANVRRELS